VYTENQSTNDAWSSPWSIPCLRQSFCTSYWWRHPIVL